MRTAANDMTYEQLIDFLENKMSMSHVYQPLLVRALVDTGGVATIRQLAQVFLTQDESQLLYYEKRIKEMPLNIAASPRTPRSGRWLISGLLALTRRSPPTFTRPKTLQAKHEWPTRASLLSANTPIQILSPRKK